MRNIICVLVFSVLLVSCGTTEKFAGTFGKRKYTKGFFFNSSSGIPAVTSRTNAFTIGEKKSKVSKPVYENTAAIQQSFAIIDLQEKKNTATSDLKNRSVRNKHERVAAAPSYKQTVESPIEIEPGTEKGIDGFTLSLSGFVLCALAILAAFIAPGLSGAVLLVGLIFSVWGFFTCRSAMHNNDKYENYARAGLIIFWITCVLLLVGYVITYSP